MFQNAFVWIFTLFAGCDLRCISTKHDSMIKDNTPHLMESIRLCNNLIKGAFNLSQPFVFPWQFSKLCGKAQLQIESSILDRVAANFYHSNLENIQSVKAAYSTIPFHPFSQQPSRLSHAIKTAIMRSNGWNSDLNELEQKTQISLLPDF